jgi:hypothetical protein
MARTRRVLEGFFQLDSKRWLAERSRMVAMCKRQGLLERGGERDDAVLAPFTQRDADATGIQVDVVEADGYQLGHSYNRCRAGS